MTTPLYQVHAISDFESQPFVVNGITNNTGKSYPMYVPLHSQLSGEGEPLLFTAFEAKDLLIKAYGNTQYVDANYNDYKLSLVESIDGIPYTMYLKEKENE